MKMKVKLKLGSHCRLFVYGLLSVDFFRQTPCLRILSVACSYLQILSVDFDDGD